MWDGYHMNIYVSQLFYELSIDMFCPSYGQLIIVHIGMVDDVSNGEEAINQQKP